MPSRKIITTIIICLGSIVSIWLLQRTPKNLLGEKATVESISNKNEAIEIDTKNEWQKILVSLDKKSQDYEDLTITNEDYFDDTTLTAQMSRDFMSQYLLLKKGGKKLTAEDLNGIANNILSSNQYQKISGAVYVPKNLKIVKDTAQSLRKYKEDINKILSNRSKEVQENPISILTNTVSTENPSMLNKFDIIIKASKGFIDDSLSIDVPLSAVSTHLNLINSVSNTSASLEGIKVAYDDPIKAMVGLSQYNNYIIIFQQRLQELNSYLIGIR